MSNIKPTQEQCKRAKQELFEMSAPFINALSKSYEYTKMPIVRMDLTTLEITITYNEDNGWEKFLKKNIDGIRLLVNWKLENNKY